MNCPRCRRENTADSRFCSYCGTEISPGTPRSSGPSGTMTFQTPTRGLTRGTVLAKRFEVIEEIGHGGMGTVYKVYDPRIDEVLAVKILKPEIASDAETIERFRNEIRLARKVAHRHVCRMYDLGEDGLTVYITMEFVPGEDLKSFIRRSKVINEAKVLDLSFQIAEGLQEAHRQGIVHRDLKPQNIMIDHEGNAKIMDFGIARSLSSRGQTGTGVIIGTPEYMAPEQADGRGADQRTDIYALGAIMFEMATGRLPFEGETPLSIVLKHKSERPAVPSELNDQLSTGLCRVIMKCLEKDPGKRYQNATALLEDLARLIPNAPTSIGVPAVQPHTLAREITLKFKPKKLILPAAALLAVVIIILLAWPGRQRTADPREYQAPATSHTNLRSVVPPPPPEPLAAADKGLPEDITELMKVFAGDGKALSSEDAKYVESGIKKLRQAYPGFSKVLDNLQAKFYEMQKLRAAGDARGSKKVMVKSGSEMKKLLSLVNERDRAETAFRSLTETKKKAAQALAGRPSNLLSWIALEKEKDATDAFGKNDFSGARILYEILEKVHVMSLTATDEDQCLSVLRKYVTGIKDEAVKAGAPEKEGWLFGRADDEEVQASKLSGEKRYSLAAEQYILSAFLYRKSIEVVVEGTQVPG